MDFNSYRIPALICKSCVRDLKKCMNFRSKVRKTDEFFKKATNEIESLIWKDNGEEASGSRVLESSRVKQEVSSENQKIKDEPDDFDLFENIDTILEENHHDGSEESNLARLLRTAKEERSSSDTSDSESEFEEDSFERKHKSKSAMRRSSEYRDFDLK